MAEPSDRDLILINFQAASGIDDLGSCFSILETNNWNLQTSLNSVFTAQENESRQQRIINVDDNPPYINLDPSPPVLQSDSTSSRKPPVRQITFQILWHDQSIPINISENETVGTLKRMLEIQSGMSHTQINLAGWPSGDRHIIDSTLLSSLNLFQETHLVLQSATKVTVSPAQYLPCNITGVPLADDRKNSDSDSPPRIIDVQFGDRKEMADITLNVNHNQRDYRLRYRANQTVKNVKQELFLLTKIATRHQDWTGWPDGTTDQSQLGTLGLSQPDHFLLLSAQPTPSSSRTAIEVAPEDSGTAGSPEDTDFDEQIISDDDDDAMFDCNATHGKRLAPLLQRDSSDNSEALINFQYQFEERYGDFHPAFFVGPLKDAIDEAAGSSAAARRPLLVYLHHDGSILTNIFCSQILCSEQFVSFISENFVIWPWDMTYESNRQRFVNMLVQHFGNTAANTVSKFRDGEYPLLLIVMKSKAGLEVCSVLQANASLDELMMSLINGYEVFEQTKIVEVKEENERYARAAMKQEQDAAYNESLAADRAKVEAERSRIREEEELQQQAHLEAQIKEAERMSCEEQLPEEPPKSATNITNILFRFPSGQREARRFLESDKLKVLFMYVASKGFASTQYRLLINFPRRELTQDNLKKSLKEMKLCPQETIFVEEI